MERLTEKHYKSDDGYYMKCSENCTADCAENCDCKEFYNIVDRLGAIEDILGDNYDLDRLRELVTAVKTKRMFVLPVLPDMRPGIRSSEVFILLDSGEVVQDNVYNISIGPNSDGEVIALLSTIDNGDFLCDDIGERVFLNMADAQHAAMAALKEEHDG